LQINPDDSCITDISSLKTVDVQDSHGFWGFHLEDLKQFLKIKLKLYCRFPLIPSLLKYRYCLKSYECLNKWPIYKQISLKLLSVEGYLALTVSYLVLKEISVFQQTWYQWKAVQFQ
jgi:hypothetical protein